MTLEEAMHKLGELEAQVKNDTRELDTLRKHKESLEADVAKQRDRAQTAEQERDTLKEQLPKDGSLVLGKADSERFAAYKALGLEPDALKSKLEKANRDAKSLTETRNKDVLGKLGIKPSALRLREFDGVVLEVSGEGDAQQVTVKQGDKEATWDAWLKEAGLESDIKDFGQEPARKNVYTAPGNPDTTTPDPTKQVRDTMFGGY